MAVITRRCLMQSMPHSNNSGFTLTELLVTISIMSLILVVFVAGLISMFTVTAREKIVLENNLNMQAGMERLEQDIRYSVEFLPYVKSPFQDPYGQDGRGNEWSLNGLDNDSSKRVLILKSYSTVGRSFSAKRDLVYINVDPSDPKPQSCSSSNRLLNPKLSYLTIYFIKDGNLYRRLVTDLKTPICNLGKSHGTDNKIGQKQTCPPDIPIASRQALCKAQDEIVLRNVSEFNIDYYREGSKNPIDGVYNNDSKNPDILFEAESANLSISVSRKFGGKDVTSNMKLKIAKVNH